MTRSQRLYFAGLLALLAVAALAMTCMSCVRNPIPAAPGTMQRPAVARLQAFDAVGDKTGTCTIWKYSDTLLVTAGHCCDAGSTYMAEGPSSVPGAPLTVLVDDDKYDICVMRGSLRGRRAPLAMQDPAVGERVWTLGYPRGTFVIGDGYWSGRDEDGDGTCSIDAIGGFSGAPILNTEGAVVGVLNKGYLGQGVTFVVPLEHLRRDLERARLTD